MIAASMVLPWLLASLACIAMPGSDSLGTLSIGLARGAREAAGFAVGVALGCLTHTLWATIGISAAVAASDTLFAAIKYLGAAYLLWLGVQALRDRGGVRLHEAPAAAVGARLRQGFVSNAINPKVMLFFLAFIPQFVDPSAGPVWLQMAALGIGFAILTGCAYVALACGSAGVGRWLARFPQAPVWLNRVTGWIFVALAVRLALSERT